MGTNEFACSANPSPRMAALQRDAISRQSAGELCGRVGNEQLIEARLALGWTQAELATAVAEHILAGTGKTTGIDADYVSRLERGLISWPTKTTRCALEVLLGRTARELGLVNRRLGGPRRRRIPDIGSSGRDSSEPVG